MILLIESGATKSDWRVVDESGELVSRHLYPGMNVSTTRMERIRDVLSEGLDASGVTAADSFYMYAAGIVTDSIRAELEDFILSKVPFRNFDLQNDLVGAARSVLGHDKGIVAIMGTGSNTCFYDGESVSQKVMSGGFILGDDGGGAALGRMFLTDFIKNLIPEDVASDFASKFDASYQGIVENVYRSQSPSGYLGSLSPFIQSHYDNPYIRNMVDENFQRFIDRSLKCYDTQSYPVGVVGGFGYANRERFSSLCAKSGIRLAGFVAEPIDGLIRYHSRWIAAILGKQIHCERMLPAFDDIQDSIYIAVPEGYNRQQRTEEFLLDDAFIDINRIYDSRWIAEIVGIAFPTENDTLTVLLNQRRWAERVMRSHQYGGGCINEVCVHMMVKGVPFGGVGHSGMGAYHGEWGFREFTHASTVLKGSTRLNLSIREHPYRGKKFLLPLLRLLEK